MDEIKQKERFDKAKHKADLVHTPEYQEIRGLQIEKCLELSKTDIEPLILKGMLKLIASTDGWSGDFDRVQNERKK